VAAQLIDAGRTTVELRDDAIRSLDVLADPDELVDLALAPHAIYTVSEPSLHWIAELAAERELPVHIHLSETEQEVIDCIKEHGQRPAAYLDHVGLLGPRTVLAHGVWLDRTELDLIAERGATLVTNPAANMKLAVGAAFPYVEARRAAAHVGLGTDGPGSNNSLDLFAEMKLFALLQKHAARHAAAVGADETWEIAMGRQAPALGGGHRLAVGAPADFLLLRPDSPELGFGKLSAGLVYAAAGSVVDTTVVAGRVLMRHGSVDGAADVLERAIERGRRLGLVAGDGAAARSAV
jgi:5-methylthioadenosine/S-adenosylhomocysteine deaminase